MKTRAQKKSDFLKFRRRSPVEVDLCVNGDGNKVCHPSKVICKDCIDLITTKLEEIVKDLGDKNDE